MNSTKTDNSQSSFSFQLQTAQRRGQPSPRAGFAQSPLAPGPSSLLALCSSGGSDSPSACPAPATNATWKLFHSFSCSSHTEPALTLHWELTGSSGFHRNTATAWFRAWAKVYIVFIFINFIPISYALAVSGLKKLPYSTKPAGVSGRNCFKLYPYNLTCWPNLLLALEFSPHTFLCTSPSFP